MSWQADILTLYPDMFPGHLGHSLAGRARERDIWSLTTHQIRDHGIGKHKNVDDTPAGGGAGMVLRADVLTQCLNAAIPDNDPRPRILLSPRGQPLTQAKVRALVAAPGLVLICGRFEGVDQRFIDQQNIEELSVGDYILSGGEVGALTLLDACIRLLPGTMGAANSGTEESFENGLLEYPHYTKPADFNDEKIPEILASGHHKNIAKWRLEQSKNLTRSRRPDLWEKYHAEIDKN